MTVLLIIILLLLLGALICVALAFKDDNTDKYYTTPSIEPAQTIALSTVAGNQANISEDDLNQITAYLIEKANTLGLFNDDCRITAAYFEINSGKPCRCYFQIDYKGKKIGFSSDIDIILDISGEQIKIAFDNCAVGRLKIPRSIIIAALKNTGLQNTTKYLSIDELTLNLPTHYGIDVPVVGTVIGIDIESIEIFDKELRLETNPVVNDALKGIKDKIGDKISGFIDDYVPESVGDLF